MLYAIETVANSAIVQALDCNKYLSCCFKMGDKAQNAGGPSSPQDTRKKRWRHGNIRAIILPLGASLLPTGFLLGAYFHADSYDLLQLKNNTDVPFVSDIGNHRPHSSVFTFGLSIGAMFGLWLILVRHDQVNKLYKNERSKADLFEVSLFKVIQFKVTMFHVNMVSSGIGLLGILGELIVAAFQLSSHFTMHYIGAMMHFIPTMFFMFLQTFITYKAMLMNERKESNMLNQSKKCISWMNDTTMLVARAVLSGLLFVFMIIFTIFLLPSLSAYNRTGYSIAQSAEWVMLATIIAYMLTFLYDFEGLTCSVHVENLKESGSTGVDRTVIGRAENSFEV